MKKVSEKANFQLKRRFVVDNLAKKMNYDFALT